MSGLSMRRPFQSSYSQQPRLSSFIGTSNFCDLLTDSSGNRRFYPVMTKGSIRLPRINYKQLYAQLRDELKHNRRYWLSPKEEQGCQLA
ncbi:virulence-associated E family protein [Phocaeicola vulgatus]|nr:virulence-associated E family protein [Phocaeicola vulgatus]